MQFRRQSARPLAGECTHGSPPYASQARSLLLEGWALDTMSQVMEPAVCGDVRSTCEPFPISALSTLSLLQIPRLESRSLIRFARALIKSALVMITAQPGSTLAFCLN
eukprot:6201655-Pleurochrysis_carterae.AAC.2